MFDVRRLGVLAEVARQGSFSGAARALGYTQPAISRQIALLEREAGTELLERRPAGVRLTPAGELLVGHAEAIARQLEAAEAELAELLGLRRGRLSICTLNSAAVTLVPPAIAAFRERHPGIELSVTLAEPREMLAQLRDGAVDLAISNTAALLELPDITGQVLFTEPLLLAVPAGHPVESDGTVRLEDLSEEEWMLGTADQTCPDSVAINAACRRAGFEPRIAFRHDDYAALLGFVAAGVGFAFVPEMMSRTARHDVRFLELGPDGPRRSVCLLSATARQSAATVAMSRILQDVSARWAAGEVLEVA